jgi:hypothetical protein
LCAVGLGLRLPGLDYLLPSVLNRDGLVVVRQVELMHSGAEHPEEDPLWALYPHLMSRLVALFPDEGAARTEPSTLAQDLARANAPWVHGRLIVALLSLLAVPGTYWLARYFLSRVAALFAAGLVATSLFHVHVSTLEKPHGIVASFLLLAIVASIRLRRRGDISSYLLCGAMVGFAMASLQDGVAALLPLGAAHIVREKGSGRRSRWWILAAIAVVALLVRCFYPFYFAAHHAEVEVSPEIARGAISLSGHRVWFSLFNGAGFPRVFGPLISCDPVLLALALAGVGLWSMRFVRSSAVRRSALFGDMAVVLAFAIPFTLLVTLYAETMGRYAIPLLPLMACAAAYAFENLFAHWTSRRPRLAAVIAAGIVLVAALPAIRLAAIRGALDTFQLAAIAIRALIDPKDRVIVVPYVDVPLYHAEAPLHDDAEVPWRTIWVQYQASLGDRERADTEFDIAVLPGKLSDARSQLLADPIEYCRRHRARYVLIEGFTVDPTLAQVRAELMYRAKRVRRLSSLTTDNGADEVMPPPHLEDRFGFPYALSLFSVDRMGSTLEIYDVSGL